MLPLPTLTAEPLQLLDRLGVDGLILSGGNNVPGSSTEDLAPQRDLLEQALLHGCMAAGRPVLGVCRGMQMINTLLGGTLRPLRGHAGGVHGVRRITAAPLPHPETLAVNSYHHFGMMPDDLGPDLEPVFVDDHGWVEALAHVQAPVVGIMWHPERTRPFLAPDIALVRRLFGDAPMRTTTS